MMKIRRTRQDMMGVGPMFRVSFPEAVAMFAVMTPIALWNISSVRADSAERVVENPPLLKLSKESPQTGPRAGIERQLDLNIEYTNSKLYNPATGTDDQVHLRSYVGTDTNPQRPYVAPTIEVTPGDTVRITLHNKLPADSSCTDWKGDANTPHCFNGTNLHSHGLWVSPTGNSDNVLLSINPGVSFQYEYNIPPDHPAGTFWYHSHRHGSTALQVSSGMAGALIVQGNRLPDEKINGDIDTLLKNSNGSALRERILVLQQIQYACLDKSGTIKVKKDSKDNVIAWVCDRDDTGGIESYNLFGPGTWGESGRYTSINGQILPTFSAKAGEIERWRMIHAGVRDTISLEFRRLKAGAPGINTLKAVDADRFIRDNCNMEDPPISYHVIANDGLTRAAAWQTSLTVLQPGYRNDALVVFPKAGEYCVIDTLAPASGSVSQSAESRQLLGKVSVSPGTEVQNIHDYLTKELIAAATRTMPDSVKGEIVADLKNGLKLTRFTPHPDIRDSEITGEQELAFFIDTSTGNTKFEISNHLDQSLNPNFKPYYPSDPKPKPNFKPYYLPDPKPKPDFKPYDPNRIDRHLTLGGVDEWTLQSYFVSHPFHIHVNPFQIIRILDPNGKDVSAPSAIDNADKTVDPQYPGLKGVWKDTLWVKSLIPPAKTLKEGIYTLVVRTRYQRYIGEYVLHCHILDHEDQGMMQNVSIDIPDSQGGANTTEHH